MMYTRAYTGKLFLQKPTVFSFTNLVEWCRNYLANVCGFACQNLLHDRFAKRQISEHILSYTFILTPSLASIVLK